jgi:hypothetical protein
MLIDSAKLRNMPTCGRGLADRNACLLLYRSRHRSGLQSQQRDTLIVEMRMHCRNTDRCAASTTPMD